MTANECNVSVEMNTYVSLSINSVECMFQLLVLVSNGGQIQDCGING